MVNYYEFLGLDESASEQEINEIIKSELSKWRKRVNAPDPKRQRDAEEKMELLQEAESILLNPVKREEYNSELIQFVNEPQAANPEANHQQPFNQAEDFIREAKELINRNQIPDAIVVARKATEADGNNSYAWSILAEAHYLWKEYNDAIYEIDRAINLLPNEAEFYYIAYLCHHAREDLKRSAKMNLAEESLEKALSIDPSHPVYMEASAEMAQFRGQSNIGINILKELERKHGLEGSAKNLLGLLYYQKGLTKAQRVNYNKGQSEYYFLSEETALEGKKIFVKALKYAQNNQLKGNINNQLNQANSALEYKNQYKILAWLILIVPFFLMALSSFSLIQILVFGAAGYFVWIKGRVPQYKINKKYTDTLS